MKRINNFMENAHLFKVYLAGVFFVSLFVFTLFHFVAPWASDGKSEFSLWVNIKISLAMGAIFGLMVMLMTQMMRKSVKFWAYAEVVEKLIDEATTKDQLKSLYKNEFHDLKYLAQGGPHYVECRRIYTILETKHKYMPNQPTENQ